MSQIKLATCNSVIGGLRTLRANPYAGSCAGRSFAAAALLALLSGCGDSTPGRRPTTALPMGTGGTDSTAGGQGGTTTTTGQGGTAPVTPAAPPTTPQVCNMTPPAADGVLIDFAEYNFPGAGAWGNSVNMHTTGGTSPYSCVDDNPTVCGAEAVLVRTLSMPDGILNVKATIPAGQYSGMVLWFTPCLNPETYDGLSMMLGGNLAGARLAVKPQAHVNYPVDVTNAKGGCLYTAEATKWSECTPPEFPVDTMEPTVAEQRLFWEDFAGGVPLQTPPLNPALGIVGLELQFQCQADVPCAIDVNFGTITFMPEGTPRLVPLDPPDAGGAPDSGTADAAL